MITTIQVHERIKNELDKLKTGKETYEELILALMKIAEQQKREQKTLLIEGYQEMTKESIAIDKEWSVADKDWE